MATVHYSEKLKNLTLYSFYKSKRVLEVFSSALRHMAEHARTHHKYKNRSGAAECATRSRVKRTDPIVGEVFVDPNIAPHGIFLFKGTRHHIITARNAKALTWYSGGRQVFARSVQHPGTKPDSFLNDAVNNGIDRLKNSVVDAVLGEI